MSDWGNGLLTYPESKNMTMLVIESSPWNNDDFAILYPTYFHPSRDDDVFQWQNRMRKLKRRLLFSFAGARRPNRDECIRNEIIDQCLVSRKRCRFLECDQNQRCYKPENLIKLFQSSSFAYNLLGIPTPGGQYLIQYWQAAFQFSSIQVLHMFIIYGISPRITPNILC